MPTILCVGEDSGLLDSRAAPSNRRRSHLLLRSGRSSVDTDTPLRSRGLMPHPAIQPNHPNPRLLPTRKISILLIEPLTGYRLAGGKISCEVMVNAEPASLIHTTANLLIS